jgi:hypothetical protein
MTQQELDQFSKLPPQQQAIAALKALEGLYQNGQTVEALTVALELGQKALVQAAWCHYRLKNYTACVETLSRTSETQSALELWAYLYAYEYTGYKDEEKLQSIVKKLEPDNVNAHNAVVIAARDKNSTLDAAEIFTKLDPWINGLDRSLATEKDANLLHNLARLALAKESFPDHLQKALELIDYTIEAYGTHSKLFHRAAAHYWRSVILEKMGKPYDAWQASITALNARSQQLELEPTNETWKQDLEKAQLREQQLRDNVTF